MTLSTASVTARYSRTTAWVVLDTVTGKQYGGSVTATPAAAIRKLRKQAAAAGFKADGRNGLKFTPAANVAS